ncbi:MAG TPA: UDP-N-acetylmuramoyl-L-alanine--D-glutamate ligase [Xanthomonadales bacterium]|nr:UDP-N-acetylmuramoyl-L-alanine--D-glutamate ligase [Xanthomonadales bacterium]
MLISELRDLNIAVLGAGREGRSAIRWLRKEFPDKTLTVYDEAEPSLEKDSLSMVVTGALDARKLQAHDLLIRSPGISPYRPALREAGVQCTSTSSLWFAAHPDARTICITGTKGKSTTAALTTQLLRAAGLQARLAGNIGQALLDCPELADGWWVIELSSYQLADLEARPSLAAILNVSDEHLDWHGNAANYRRDKLRLAELATGSPLILNHNDELLRAQFEDRHGVHWFGHQMGWHVRENRLYRDRKAFEGIPRQALPGAHNLENLAAALTLMEAAGIDVTDPGAALEAFRGLPHRLQVLGEAGGVLFVNDSLATTPVATLAALMAYRERPVILLAGGLDRGVDWRPMLDQMREITPAAVICLPDSGPSIARLMEECGLQPERGIHRADGLAAAMRTARGLSRAGDVVLLSPGAASFPQFRDYADRGRQFADLAGLVQHAG